MENNKNINALNISEFESSIYPKYAIIALPSNFSNEQYRFDTRIIESIIEKIKNFNNDTNIVIKSTIPIGFTEYINKKSLIQLTSYFLLNLLEKGIHMKTIYIHLE